MLRHRQHDPRARWRASSRHREPYSGRHEPARRRERVAHAARAGPAGVRGRPGGGHPTSPGESSRTTHARGRMRRRVPVLRRAAARRDQRHVEGANPEQRVRAGDAVLPGEPAARTKVGRDRRRVVRGEGAAADSRQRIRDSHARSGAVGVPHDRQLPRRCAEGREPRRRRRHAPARSTARSPALTTVWTASRRSGGRSWRCAN